MSEVLKNLDAVVPAAVRAQLLRQAVARRPESPDLLVDLAEALADSDRPEEAVDTYRRAVEGKAVWRFPPLKLARALIAHGMDASDIVAGLAIAEGAAGNAAAVKRLIDFDRFFRSDRLDAPDGFAEGDFHAILAAELKSGMTFYDQPKDHATRKSWRNDSILRSQHPAWLALIGQLFGEFERYSKSLPEDPDHPFLRSRPAKLGLQGWALVSGDTGYIESHYHHRAWATAVYYVASSSRSHLPGATDGWLHVGPPENFGAMAGWEERLVEPAPGTLVIMPAYFFHRTRPTGFDQERICVVLDIAEEARSNEGQNAPNARR